MIVRKEMAKKSGLLLLCLFLSFGAVSREAFLSQKDNRNCVEADISVTEALPETEPGKKALLADLGPVNRVRRISLYFEGEAPEQVEVRYTYPAIQSRIYKELASVHDGKAEFQFCAPKQMANMGFFYDAVQGDLPDVVFNEEAAEYKTGLLKFFVLAVAGTALLLGCAWLFDRTRRRCPLLLLLMSAALFWMAVKTLYRYGAHPVTWGVAAVSAFCIVAVSCCLGGSGDEEI